MMKYILIPLVLLILGTATYTVHAENSAATATSGNASATATAGDTSISSQSSDGSSDADSNARAQAGDTFANASSNETIIIDTEDQSTFVPRHQFVHRVASRTSATPTQDQNKKSEGETNGQVAEVIPTPAPNPGDDNTPTVCPDNSDALEKLRKSNRILSALVVLFLLLALVLATLLFLVVRSHRHSQSQIVKI